MRTVIKPGLSTTELQQLLPRRSSGTVFPTSKTDSGILPEFQQENNGGALDTSKALTFLFAVRNDNSQGSLSELAAKCLNIIQHTPANNWWVNTQADRALARLEDLAHYGMGCNF